MLQMTSAVLVWIATAWYAIASAHADGASCPEGAWKEGAETCFTHWRSLVNDAKYSRNQPLYPNTTILLEQLGMLSDKDRCIYWFRWEPSVKEFFFEPPLHHCNGHLKTHMWQRLLAYKIWFQLAVSKYQDTKPFTRAFHFYIDAADGHRAAHALVNILRRPLLAQSTGPTADYSIVVPDYHMIAAHLTHFGKEVPKQGEAFKRAMTTIYTQPGTSATWEQKQPEAVYRGCCYPTMDTRNARGDGYVYPRADLCQAAGTTPGFDIGLDLCAMAEHCQNGIMQDLCKGCSTCQDLPKLSRDEMTGFKYQIDVDGFGGSYDGRFQKLKSGAAVFLLASTLEDGKSRDLHQQWYSPLLVDGKNIFKTTAHELPQAVQWCKENDGKCKEVAEAGQHLVQCVVTPDASLLYTYKVLKLLHDQM